MRTIITLGVGFWLGREIYLRYDKGNGLKRELKAKDRLDAVLRKNGWKTHQIKKAKAKVFTD